MIPKNRRLNRLLFVQTQKQGHRINGHLFSLVYLPIKKLSFEQSTFAVVVSTKVSKSAVKRNRLKRLIYDHLGKNSYPFRLIINPKPQVINLTDDQICSEVDSLISKISLT